MKICYIVNNISETSIPIEVANHIEKIENIMIISLYDCSSNNLNNMISCGFKNSKVNGILKLVSLIKESNFDIIHTHHSISGSIVRLMSKYLTQAKIVTTVHTDVIRFSWLSKAILKLGIKNNDMVICNSENTKSSFLQIYGNIVPDEKLSVIYNGVDKTRILTEIDTNILIKYNIISDYKVIGIIARLEKVKNHMVLLRALKELYKEDKSYRLIIVGDGKEKVSLSHYVSENNLEDIVTFTGVLVKDDAYKVLNSLDVFVMPSFYEGFCNSVVEAMFAKKKLVVSDINTLREVTKNSARYFQVNNHIQLANEISKSLSSDDTIENLYNIAKRYYTIELTVENHIKLYRRLLEVSK